MYQRMLNYVDNSVLASASPSNAVAFSTIDETQAKPASSRCHPAKQDPVLSEIVPDGTAVSVCGKVIQGYCEGY